MQQHLQFSPVILPRLRSQTAINSTADRCLSSVPRLLENWPAGEEEQCSANGVVRNNGYVSQELGTYDARMKTVRRYFRACQRDTLFTAKQFDTYYTSWKLTLPPSDWTLYYCTICFDLIVNI